MKTGVICLQGDVSEHIGILAKLNANPFWVREKKDLLQATALIIPGGESTTISRLMSESGLFETVKKRAEGGMPVFGTCAGLILLAKEGDSQVERTGQRLLGLMDMAVNRNAFGRQRESFEETVSIKGIGSFPGVFIRAPSIRKVYGKCSPLSQLGDKIIAAMQDNLLATAFHPELTGDERVHRYFLEEIC